MKAHAFIKGSLLALTAVNAQAQDFKTANNYERRGLYYLGLHERINAVRARGYNAREVERIGDTALVLNRLEALPALAQAIRGKSNPKAWPASFSVALAAERMRNGRLAEAAALMPPLSAISDIPSQQVRYSALLVTAALYYSEKRIDTALDVLKAAIGRVEGFDAGLARLLRARMFYEIGKNVEATEEVAQIPKSSPSWFSGTQVHAWASYRAKDYNLTLGQLMSLHNPFMMNKFTPDTYILEAGTLFKLCYYESAQRAIQKLREKYQGLSNSLQRFSRQFGGRAALVSTVINYVRGDDGPGSEYPKGHFDQIMDGVAAAEPVGRADRALNQIAREERALSKGKFKNSSALRAELEVAKAEVYKVALSAATARLAQMERELNESLEGAYAIDVEINTRIRERLIKGSTAAMKDIDFETEIRKGYEFWPFQGEYWRDEIGGYAFATSDVCDQGGT